MSSDYNRAIIGLTEILARVEPIFVFEWATKFARKIGYHVSGVKSFVHVGLHKDSGEDSLDIKQTITIKDNTYVFLANEIIEAHQLLNRYFNLKAFL